MNMEFLLHFCMEAAEHLEQEIHSFSRIVASNNQEVAGPPEVLCWWTCAGLIRLRGIKTLHREAKREPHRIDVWKVHFASGKRRLGIAQQEIRSCEAFSQFP